MGLKEVLEGCGVTVTDNSTAKPASVVVNSAGEVEFVDATRPMVVEADSHNRTSSTVLIPPQR